MKQQRINEILGFVFLGIGIMVLVSLMTFDPNDIGFFSSTANVRMQNFAGIIGAYLSAFLFFLIGNSSYIIPVLCLIWAVNKFTEEEGNQQKLYIKIIGAVVFFLTTSALLSLIFGISNADKMRAGGIFGMMISTVLEQYFGAVGAYIISLTLLILSILLATELLIIPIVIAIISKMKESYKNIRIQQPASAERQRPQINIRGERKEVIRSSKIKEQADTAKMPPEPIIKEKPKLEITKPMIKIDTRPSRAIGAAAKLAKRSDATAEDGKSEIIKPAVTSVGEYKFPSLDLLDSPPPVAERQIKEDLAASSAILEGTLQDFGIDAKVAQVEKGPVITRYELEPSPGVKINSITALADDIALTMKAQSVRIIAPIPGKSRVGVEVPNMESTLVYLKEVLESSEFQSADSKLTLALGKDTAGAPVVCDLGSMPHLLIAGTTGSGKTVCVNSIILSMLFNASPDELKFILVDPKMVEMAMFNKLPHLLCPVVTAPKKVSAALGWVVSEMETRYQLFAKLGVRNIDIFNDKKKEGKFKDDSDVPDKLPYIVVIIDELADLMAVASQDIENAITRLAQLSRAVGIHIILATQRPSVDVVTGVIKANFPARISFKVASKVDSRTVLDANGADKLLGKGDMLFLEPGVAKPTRAQSSLVSDREIERVVDFISSQRQPDYEDAMIKEQEKKAYGREHEKDEYYDDAVKMVMEVGQASVSMLQRRMRLSYTRAARLIDSMEEEGLIGPYRGSKPREILVDRQAYIAEEQQQEKAQETV